eukprot:936288-Prymnesium_polylepis.1
MDGAHTKLYSICASRPSTHVLLANWHRSVTRSIHLLELGAARPLRLARAAIGALVGACAPAAIAVDGSRLGIRPCSGRIGWRCGLGRGRLNV